jgi:DNA-binding XRE family transcriptional regulator
MIDGVRLGFLLRERGLSQSELARRIGISQQAIHKLIVGQSRGSTHIVALARELGTTPAYLAGEIDDPDEGAPPPPPKPTAQVATMQVLLPDTRALERMFLAVLKASEGLSQEALAHELALLLPKGLSLLRGPLVFADPVPDDDRPTDPEAVDADRPARRRA